MENNSTVSEEGKLDRLEEALWVARARSGDSDAFVHLMRRHEAPLLYYLRRMVPRGDATLDLHQEVWIDVFHGLKTLQSPGAFRTWLYQIAHHKAASFVRRETRREEFAAGASEDMAGEFASESGENLDAETVHLALGSLPPVQREILTLHYLRDLSVEEIAGAIDCPAGTVKSRLHHARHALRRLIERINL